MAQVVGDVSGLVWVSVKGGVDFGVWGSAETARHLLAISGVLEPSVIVKAQGVDICNCAGDVPRMRFLGKRALMRGFLIDSVAQRTPGCYINAQMLS